MTLSKTQFSTENLPNPSPSPSPRSNELIPSVRLTALDPPSWNGVKADFCTWKRKFIHIMEEARISNELTQLCYLQNQKTLPSSYQILISDSSTMNEVWSRLEERVPKETIKFEIIAEFRKLKTLPGKPNPTMLRDFANEISLFSRRMTDLNYNESNYMCMIMQDIYERLNHDIALRYRNKLSLQKDIGQNVEEGIDSLCRFLRAEATTLELTSSSTPNLSSVKTINAVHDEISVGEKLKFSCLFGCKEAHRLIDCQKYMAMTPEKRRNFIKDSFRCYICLGSSHRARNCLKKRENKCNNCSEGIHHWSTCLKKPEEKSDLIQEAIHR